MALFTAATSDVAVTLTQFFHKVTPDAIAVTRELLGIDVSTPDADVEVTVPSYFATKRGKTCHDAHRGIAVGRTFATRASAVDAGLGPCGVCKP